MRMFERGRMRGTVAARWRPGRAHLRTFHLATAMAAALLAGCAGLGGDSEKKKTFADTGPCAGLNPRIYSIGTTKILVFEKPRVGDPTDDGKVGLEILVEGQDLSESECFQVGVKVGGTINAVGGRDPDFGRSKIPERAGAFTTNIYNRYLERVRTGDQLEVVVTVQPGPSFSKTSRHKIITYATRRFTLYTAADFRNKVLIRRVPPEDINAFPLPKKEAKLLFGPVVADNYFAVRLSIRNTGKDDKLVSTGMIVANGRMIVEPHEQPTDEFKRFTVPIELAPQSLEQIYRIVDDAETDQPRSIFFRGLEFVGALATATSSAFFSSQVLSDSIGLFTGIAIPQGRKLWTDPWPAYKRNIVGFAMPDLLKVSGGAVAGHKYIFFSKNKLEAIISDQNLFGDFEDDQPEQPKMAIAQVQFDSLQIPFEKVFTVEAVNFQDRVGALREELPALVASLGDIDRAWKAQSGSRLFTRLEWTDLRDLAALLGTAINKATAQRDQDEAPDTDFAAAKQAAEQAFNGLAGVLNVIAQTIKNIDDDQEKPLDAALSRTIKDDIIAALAKLSTAREMAVALSGNTRIYTADADALRRRAEALASYNERFTEAAKALDALVVAENRTRARELVEGAASEVDAATKEIKGSRSASGALVDQLNTLLVVARGIEPEPLRLRLLGNERYGLSALERHQRTLRGADIAITRGAETTGFEKGVEAAESSVKQARHALNFVELAGDKLAGGKDGQLGTLARQINEGDLTKKAVEDWVANLRLHFVELLRRAHEGLDIVPELGGRAPQG